MLILDDTNNRSRRVESISEEEESEKIGKRKGQFLVLLGRDPNLFPPDRPPVTAFGERRSTSVLLEEEPRETENDPVAVGECEDILTSARKGLCSRC